MAMKLTIPAALALLAASLSPAAAVDADKPLQLVDDAVITVETLLRDQNLGGNLANALDKARAVLIVPALIKAGFIIGGRVTPGHHHMLAGRLGGQAGQHLIHG